MHLHSTHTRSAILHAHTYKFLHSFTTKQVSFNSKQMSHTCSLGGPLTLQVYAHCTVELLFTVIAVRPTLSSMLHYFSELYRVVIAKNISKITLFTIDNYSLKVINSSKSDKYDSILLVVWIFFLEGFSYWASCVPYCISVRALQFALILNSANSSHLIYVFTCWLPVSTLK